MCIISFNFAIALWNRYLLSCPFISCENWDTGFICLESHRQQMINLEFKSSRRKGIRLSHTWTQTAFKVRTQGIASCSSSGAGIQTQEVHLDSLLGEGSSLSPFLILPPHFLSHWEQCGRQPAPTFSSRRNLPSFHPFCLSVPGSSGFSGLSWNMKDFFLQDFFPYLLCWFSTVLKRIEGQVVSLARLAL